MRVGAQLASSTVATAVEAGVAAALRILQQQGALAPVGATKPAETGAGTPKQQPTTPEQASLSLAEARSIVRLLPLSIRGDWRGMLQAGHESPQERAEEILGRPVAWGDLAREIDKALQLAGAACSFGELFRPGDRPGDGWHPTAVTFANLCTATEEYLDVAMALGSALGGADPRGGTEASPRASQPDVAPAKQDLTSDQASRDDAATAKTVDPSPTACPVAAVGSVPEQQDTAGGLESQVGEGRHQEPSSPTEKQQAHKRDQKAIAGGDPADAVGAILLTAPVARKVVARLDASVLPELLAVVYAGAGATRAVINHVRGQSLQVTPLQRELGRALIAEGVLEGFEGVFPESGDGRVKLTRWKALPATIDALAAGLTDRLGTAVTPGAPRAWKTKKSGRWHKTQADAVLPESRPGLLSALRVIPPADQTDPDKDSPRNEAIDDAGESSETSSVHAVAGGAVALSEALAAEIVAGVSPEVLSDLEAIVRAGSGATRAEVKVASGQSVRWALVKREVHTCLARHQVEFDSVFPSTGNGSKRRLVGLPVSLQRLCSALRKIGRDASLGPVRAFKHRSSGRIVVCGAEPPKAPSRLQEEEQQQLLRSPGDNADAVISGELEQVPRRTWNDDDEATTLLGLREGSLLTMYRTGDD